MLVLLLAEPPSGERIQANLFELLAGPLGSGMVVRNSSVAGPRFSGMIELR